MNDLSWSKFVFFPRFLPSTFAFSFSATEGLWFVVVSRFYTVATSISNNTPNNTAVYCSAATATSTPKMFLLLLSTVTFFFAFSADAADAASSPEDPEAYQHVSCRADRYRQHPERSFNHHDLKQLSAHSPIDWEQIRTNIGEFGKHYIVHRDDFGAAINRDPSFFLHL